MTPHTPNRITPEYTPERIAQQGADVLRGCSSAYELLRQAVDAAREDFTHARKFGGEAEQAFAGCALDAAEVAFGALNKAATRLGARVLVRPEAEAA